jgi:hypothetical protein
METRRKYVYMKAVEPLSKESTVFIEKIKTV